MISTFTCEKCGGGSYEQFSQTQVRCLHCSSISVYDTGYKPQQEHQLSSDANLLDFEKKTVYIPVSLGKRFANYILDILFIAFIFAIVANLFNMSTTLTAENTNNSSGFLFIAFFAVYYIFMEYKFGKTIGKFITRTKVVSTDGNELTISQCIGRLLCRIIPLEWLSGILFKGIFWHDSIPKTMVVEDEKI